MKLHWTDVTVAAVLVGVGCVATYAGFARLLRRAVADRERETDQKINAMAATVQALQARVAELGRLQAERMEDIEVPAVTTIESEVSENGERVKPEIVAAMTAAATAFLGKKARIRSVQALPGAQDTAGAWAQQGRVIVQTSHNLRQNG
ncbi:MAG: hypothetical protein WBC92_14015 [Terracidiphilus sp.]